MPSSARRSSGHLSVAAFRASRPDEERWELIDGVPVMMTPPTLAHQRIASNLERLLNEALEAANLPFEAYQRAGLNLANVEYYDPEPDAVVVDRPQRSDQRYCDRFHVAAEVVSPAMRPPSRPSASSIVIIRSALAFSLSARTAMKLCDRCGSARGGRPQSSLTARTSWWSRHAHCAAGSASSTAAWSG